MSSAKKSNFTIYCLTSKYLWNHSNIPESIFCIFTWGLGSGKDWINWIQESHIPSILTLCRFVKFIEEEYPPLYINSNREGKPKWTLISGVGPQTLEMDRSRSGRIHAPTLREVSENIHLFLTSQKTSIAVILKAHNNDRQRAIFKKCSSTSVKKNQCNKHQKYIYPATSERYHFPRDMDQNFFQNDNNFTNPRLSKLEHFIFCIFVICFWQVFKSFLYISSFAIKFFMLVNFFSSFQGFQLLFYNMVCFSFIYFAI